MTEFRTGRDRGVSSRNDRARLPETAAAPERAAAGGNRHQAVESTGSTESLDAAGCGHGGEVAGAADEPDESSRSSREKPAVSAYGRALGLLGRREHSRRELKDKLVARGLADDEIDAALVKLDDKGFQSDQRFAEMIARSRVAQGHGPVRILAELRMHGIDTGTAQAALDEQGADWLELARALCRRRFRGPAGDHAERVKRGNFLARRGFPSSIARAAASASGHADQDGD